MAKLAKDMTDEEFDIYVKSKFEEIRALVPKDLCLCVVLCATGGSSFQFRTNLSPSSAAVIMESVAHECKQFSLKQVINK